MICITFVDSYAYFGDRLATGKVVISTTPRYTEGGKHTFEHYAFAAENYPCTFIITETPLLRLKENSVNENIFKATKVGDTISVNITRTDKQYLYDSSACVGIVGLKKAQTQLINPIEVAERDKKKRKDALLLGSIVIILCSVWEIYNFIKKRNRNRTLIA